MLWRLIGEDIELVLAAEPALGAVRADAGQLEQVLVNLAVNARDAMPQGGRLTIGTANAALGGGDASPAPEAPPGPYVSLAVTDPGVGMDADTRAHLSEPFFTTKPRGKGTGLGLATVYGIVRQSGGHIAVDTAPGRGSAFHIYLPRVAEAPEPAGSARAVVAPAPGRETVLLAEDEQLVRLLARKILEQAGYTVLVAAGGAEALQLATQHAGPLDLLVTDVVMPEMSGRELVHRLPAQRPHTPGLYMSGYADQAIERHGGVDPGPAVIQKAFTPAGLARKVREVLDEK